MSLVRNVGTIGGLTAVSRVFGFIRDVLLARLLGAGLAADAFQLAFVLPNTFRRLFAEGAFSVAFVPLYTRVLHGGARGAGAGEAEEGEAAAARFASDVLAIFAWALIALSAVALLAMPAIVWLLASDFTRVPGKFALSVTLSRIAFPYLGLVAIVALLSGLLNARSRFAPGAISPLFLNLVLIASILAGERVADRGGGGEVTVAYAAAIGVSVAGLVQLAAIAWAARGTGVRARLRPPRLTPEVRRLAAMILPATAGASIYQASQFVDTFFATTLPQGSLTLLKYADRLNQMPLGVVGMALGTAILPMLARHIHAEAADEAERVQANAVELATLLAFPAGAALAVCAPAFVTALFVGGRMTVAEGVVMSDIVIALGCGLPAYVLIKVFQPAFFSRGDTRTPMLVAAGALVANIAANFAVVPRFGVVGLAAATAAAAALNAVALAAILHARGWFAISLALWGRVARQLAATAAMAALLWVLEPVLAPRYAGSALDRAWSLAALFVAGIGAFAAAALATGVLDNRLLAQLRRRRASGEPPAPTA